jgi:hypothetical protein
MSTGDASKTAPPTVQPGSTDDTTDPSTDPANEPATPTDPPADGSAASAAPPADGAADPADPAAEGGPTAPADGAAGGSTEAPTNGSTESAADRPTDQAGSPATADSASSDSTNDNSGDCAEIPCAAHAVLTAAIKLAVRIPHSTDEARQLPHKLTLSNDDGSYTKTLTLASDCQPGGVDGTSMVTFEDMTEQHTYTLQCDNGDTTYALFKDLTYEQVLKFVAQDDGGSSEAATSADLPTSTPAGDTAGAP